MKRKRSDPLKRYNRRILQRMRNALVRLAGRVPSTPQRRATLAALRGKCGFVPFDDVRTPRSFRPPWRRRWGCTVVLTIGGVTWRTRGTYEIKGRSGSNVPQFRVCYLEYNA